MTSLREHALSICSRDAGPSPYLGELTPGGRRYQDLHDALEHISYKVLTDTLRRAERDGLITRHLDERRVETATLYELTDLGQSLDVPLTASGATGSHRAVWVRP